MNSINEANKQASQRQLTSLTFTDKARTLSLAFMLKAVIY